MKGWIGWILLVLSLLITLAGYRNSRAEPETEEQARGLVCSGVKDCVKSSELPHTVRTDYVRRRYEWATTVGPIHVVCRRVLYLIGNWSCEAKQGPLPP
jgi:hypothetical protein